MNCWPSGKYVRLLYMYSILGRGTFCFNYCLNSAWHGGDQFVALLRWYGSPGFFDSGLQLICIFCSLVSHFPLDNTHRWYGSPASLAMNVWGLPSLWRVSMIVFWTTVRSAVFLMIVSPSEPNWETISKAQETFAGVLSWLADWPVTICIF